MNLLITIKHPKISLLVEKLKFIIKNYIEKYYKEINKNNHIDNNLNREKNYCNTENYIFKKILNFISKNNLLANNPNEIYNIIIYLWIDIIHNECEDEDLLKLYYNILNNMSIETKSKTNKKIEQKDINNVYVEKMFKNLDSFTENINTINILDKENNEIINSTNKTNDNSNKVEEIDNYFVINKDIKIYFKFLKWNNNSCRFDSFLFIFIYAILPYIEKDNKNNLMKDEFIKFMIQLKKDFILDNEIVF